MYLGAVAYPSGSGLGHALWVVSDGTFRQGSGGGCVCVAALVRSVTVTDLGISRAALAHKVLAKVSGEMMI